MSKIQLNQIFSNPRIRNRKFNHSNIILNVNNIFNVVAKQI